MIHTLSSKIPVGANVYLGNSLPIREWDLGATREDRHFQMGCNRGVNGIDGQVATFLGFCSSKEENWAILGDLTLLYDLVAPWVTPQLGHISATLVVVNNGGGKIFSPMFAHSAFQNTHQLTFEPLARFWGWGYERWETIPESILTRPGRRMIELVPDAAATDRFRHRFKEAQ